MAGLAPAAALSEARRERRLSRPARRAFSARPGVRRDGAGVAVVVPPFGLWPSWRELGADYRTAKGEQRRVVLPGPPCWI